MVGTGDCSDRADTDQQQQQQQALQLCRARAVSIKLISLSPLRVGDFSGNAVIIREVQEPAWIQGRIDDSNRCLRRFRVFPKASDIRLKFLPSGLRKDGGSGHPQGDALWVGLSMFMAVLRFWQGKPPFLRGVPCPERRQVHCIRNYYLEGVLGATCQT